MRRIALLANVLAFGTGLAAATPYEILYTGDNYPEREPGWQRNFGGGGAIRSIEPAPDDPNNHFLRMDSRQDDMIYDFAIMHRQINPTEPGELFSADWRVCISDNFQSYDQGVVFARDGFGTLAFRYAVDHVHSEREGWSWPIAPYVFHTYHLESVDMITYGFWIDGEYVRDGTWDLNSLNASYVTFGDGTQGGGAGSLAYWDYFRFGVYAVPEPFSGSSAEFVGGIWGNRLRRFPQALSWGFFPLPSRGGDVSKRRASSAGLARFVRVAADADGSAGGGWG